MSIQTSVGSHADTIEAIALMVELHQVGQAEPVGHVLGVVTGTEPFTTLLELRIEVHGEVMAQSIPQSFDIGIVGAISPVPETLLGLEIFHTIQKHDVPFR